LRDATNRIEGWIDAGHDVYAYFNNDYLGAAVEDATWLARRLGRDPDASARLERRLA
jgi:uncharacterized protein YecE (DUF72 family)